MCGCKKKIWNYINTFEFFPRANIYLTTGSFFIEKLAAGVRVFGQNVKDNLMKISCAFSVTYFTWQIGFASSVSTLVCLFQRRLPTCGRTKANGESVWVAFAPSRSFRRKSRSYTVFRVSVFARQLSYKYSRGNENLSLSSIHWIFAIENTFYRGLRIVRNIVHEYDYYS